MDSQKIIIDGNEVEIYTSLKDEEIENNNDLFYKKELLEDTIELSDVVKKIENGENDG